MAGSVNTIVPVLLVRLVTVIQFDRLVEPSISIFRPTALETVNWNLPPATRWGDSSRMGVITLKGVLKAVWPAPSSALSTTLVAIVATVVFPFHTPLTKAPEELGLTATELEKTTW